MYNFLTGPLAWFSFLVFFIGMLMRSILYLKGLDLNIDRVTYSVNTSFGMKEAVRSVFFWTIPFATRGWRTQPLMTSLFFIFHICMLTSTFFLKAHNMILKERWGVSIITIPDIISDYLTIAVLVTAVILLIRRITLPQVRILTKISDYLILIISIAPFLTGFLAFHQFGNYPFWMCTHIISGELLLVVIPFTKLSHSFLFFFSRAQLGMDYGIKRGGMKRQRGMTW
ncbi:MAG: respiratory nitrate reductase subunit gamma [Desulfobacula sp.]|nr:respiratory nitrate reductase subunit gamma [Desulfobacula sp.]